MSKLLITVAILGKYFSLYSAFFISSIFVSEMIGIFYCCGCCKLPP